MQAEVVYAGFARLCAAYSWVTMEGSEMCIRDRLYYYGICQALGTPIGFWPLFLYGFVLAVPGDLVLCVVGAVSVSYTHLHRF